MRSFAASLAAAALGTNLALHGEARAAHSVRAWPANRPTPPLDLIDLEGRPWSLAEVQGRPLLLNFWATWCEPCRAEMPSLEWLASRHRSAGLAVVTVNFKEPAATIRRYLQTLPLSLPILLDADGDAASAWTPRVLPTTVLVDRSGAARRTVLGELDWLGAEARALIEPLLSAAPRGRVA